MFRRTVIVPYGRMQLVDVTTGPVDRWLGIAAVQLHTAAATTDASIPGLTTDEAAGCATTSRRSARPGRPACDRSRHRAAPAPSR